jgi:hypothetical protein
MNIKRVLTGVSKYLGSTLKDFYYEGGPMVLCLFGGLLLVLAHDLDLDGFAGFASFLLPVLVWSFALDLVRQKAESKGRDKGMIYFIQALRESDECNINIIEHDKDKSDDKKSRTKT